MKTFRERLDFALKQRGITQAEFARRIDRSSANVNQWKARGGITRTYFIKSCETLNVNPTWLSEGKGTWNDSLKARGTQNTYVITHKQVPLISSVAAGNWTDTADNYQPGNADEWYPTTETNSSRAFALRIQGDSMEPDIKDREIVIVDPDLEAMHNNVIIVRQNGNTEATCKRLIIEGGKKYLKPINTRYPIMEMLADAEICGVVVESLRSWV